MFVDRQHQAGLTNRESVLWMEWLTMFRSLKRFPANNRATATPAVCRPGDRAGQLVLANRKIGLQHT